jgi:hypothetical protein
MKTRTKLTLAVTTLLASVTLCSAEGYHYVRPYTDRNGHYHQGHNQTNPDGDPSNNWNEYPNVNPFTGRPGTLHTMPRSSGYHLDPESNLYVNDLD